MRTLRYAAVTILLLSEGPLLRTTCNNNCCHMWSAIADACRPHIKKASAYRYCGPHITTYNSSMRTLRSVCHSSRMYRSMQTYSSSMQTQDTQQYADIQQQYAHSRYAAVCRHTAAVCTRKIHSSRMHSSLAAV
jgi:hypothetical protein